MKKIIKKIFFSFYGRFFLVCKISVSFFYPFSAIAKEAPPLKGLQGNTPKPPMTDIHDIKPLLNISRDIPWVAILVVAAIIIIFLAAFLYWRHLRKSVEVKEAIAELPPEVNAHRALNQMADLNQIDGKLFYFNISAILRQYIYERFHLNAPEMTTEELLPRLVNLNLDADLYEGVARLCQGADPIKFAGKRPQIRQMELDLMVVRKFVDGTTLINS